MTARELIDLMARCVTFPPGIASKRFVQDTASASPEHVMSERAERFAWRIAYVYRRQLPNKVAEEATRRKVDHKWTISHETQSGRVIPKCATCGNFMHSKREENAPCAGPSAPPKTPRRRSSTAQGAVAVAKPPIDAPNLFEEMA